MKPEQEVFYLPHLTVRIFPVIYKGSWEGSKQHSLIVCQGTRDAVKNENLFETKKEALEELLKRAEDLAQKVRMDLDKLAEEETNNVGRL